MKALLFIGLSIIYTVILFAQRHFVIDTSKSIYKNLPIQKTVRFHHHR
jgi:hypothetical protein